MTHTILLDPTSELGTTERARAPRPSSLDGLTIGLLDIAKRKGDVFLDRLEALLVERGLRVERFAKPTNTKTAALELQEEIARSCDAVIEALAD